MSRLARSRAGRWGALVLGLATAALVVVALARDGSDAAARARQADPAWCTPGTQRSALCPNAADFDPQQYATHGDAFECVGFANQADAQAVLRADPSDPNRLDDGGGVACRGLPAPRDTTPVTRTGRTAPCEPGESRSARCPERERPFEARYFLRHGTDAYDCRDLASQADAQAVLRFAPGDPNRLDPDRSGIACPELPAPKDPNPVRRSAP
ncbi:hypothetical protein ACIRBX_26070 [Kitasatospora sp. NPDC096147]|uniref:hypothetical protein n=1 Tax=Kitasatospora sp. NPDC096147 TaxID=3364093 RepID=UPI0038290724